MNPLAKRKENARARKYISENPACTYEQLVKELGTQSLTKSYFFNMRGALRKQGKIHSTDKPTVLKSGMKSGLGGQDEELFPSLKKFEILHSMESSAITPELREIWKSTVLPILRKLVPNGNNIQFAFLTDPQILEIRKEIQ